MLRKVVWILGGLFALLILAAVLFPIFVQADRYSGPGVITDALILDENGNPEKNATVQVYLRGNSDKLTTVQTDGLGELVIDRHKLKVDQIKGYDRQGLTDPDAGGYHHPIFWRTTPGNAPGRPLSSQVAKIRWPGSPHTVLVRD